MYNITYDIVHHPEGITKEQIPAGHGACDAVFMASIIYPPDGSLSMLFLSKDGRTGEDLTDNEGFKVWSLLSTRLAKSETLDPSKKELCQTVFDIICAAIRK